MIRTTLFLMGLLSLGCNAKKFSCDEERQGDWAIRIFEDPDENGQCPQGGSVIFEGDTETPLSCEREDKSCVCRAGTDFGTYEIFMTNPETGGTVRAVQEVEAAPSPICVTRDTLEPLTPVDEPSPQGGAGGAGN